MRKSNFKKFLEDQKKMSILNEQEVTALTIAYNQAGGWLKGNMNDDPLFFAIAYKEHYREWRLGETGISTIEALEKAALWYNAFYKKYE